MQRRCGAAVLRICCRSAVCMSVHLSGLSCCSYSVSQRLAPGRSEEHTSELQSLMRISYAVFCLIKKIRLSKVNNTLRFKQVHILMQLKLTQNLSNKICNK